MQNFTTILIKHIGCTQYGLGGPDTLISYISKEKLITSYPPTTRNNDSGGSRNSGGGRGGRGGGNRGAGGRSGGRGGGGAGPRNPRNQEPRRDRPGEERGPRGDQQAKDAYYKVRKAALSTAFN